MWPRYLFLPICWRDFLMAEGSLGWPACSLRFWSLLVLVWLLRTAMLHTETSWFPVVITELDAPVLPPSVAIQSELMLASFLIWVTGRKGCNGCGVACVGSLCVAIDIAGAGGQHPWAHLSSDGQLSFALHIEESRERPWFSMWLAFLLRATGLGSLHCLSPPFSLASPLSHHHVCVLLCGIC